MQYLSGLDSLILLVLFNPTCTEHAKAKFLSENPEIFVQRLPANLARYNWHLATNWISILMKFNNLLKLSDYYFNFTQFFN